MSSEPSKSVIEAIDEVEANGSENQRLIDPHETPEKLKSFQYALAVPCPTRTMTRETGLAFANLTAPMFGNYFPISPDALEVGEARNRCVEIALEAGVPYIMFVDYDVTPPPNAVIKLLSLKTDIAAGVYHLKQVPSYPLIFVEGWPGAFEDYETGDLIKADGVGMGCTLINMEVFKNIDPPWFKTVPGYSEKSPNILLPHLTEDIYFCRKARDAGYDIIVDTSVQAGHVDWRMAIEYIRVPDPNDPKKGSPGWRYADRDTNRWVVGTVATADHPGTKYADTTPPKKAKKTKAPKWIDLGSGPVPPEAYVGIDAYAEGPNVLNGDISDLSWYRTEHGLAERIRASHSLEHMSHQRVSGIFRDWVNTLVPGGEMEIRVPDGEYHMRKLIEFCDEGKDDDAQCDWLNATIYGLQIGEGQEHKTLFTKRRLEAFGRSHGLEDVKVECIEHEGDDTMIPTTAELVLTGKKKKE
jgi:hypothetical protein